MKTRERLILVVCCTIAIIALVAFVLTNPLVMVTTDYDRAPQPIHKVQPGVSADVDGMSMTFRAVRVEMIVGKKGQVLTAKVISSDASSDEEKIAIKMAKRWRFIPANKNEYAVNARYVTSIFFSDY